MCPLSTLSSNRLQTIGNFRLAVILTYVYATSLIFFYVKRKMFYRSHQYCPKLNRYGLSVVIKQSQRCTILSPVAILQSPAATHHFLDQGRGRLYLGGTESFPIQYYELYHDFISYALFSPSPLYPSKHDILLYGVKYRIFSQFITVLRKYIYFRFYDWSVSFRASIWPGILFV